MITSGCERTRACWNSTRSPPPSSQLRYPKWIVINIWSPRPAFQSITAISAEARQAESRQDSIAIRSCPGRSGGGVLTDRARNRSNPGQWWRRERSHANAGRSSRQRRRRSASTPGMNKCWPAGRGRRQQPEAEIVLCGDRIQRAISGIVIGPVTRKPASPPKDSRSGRAW